MSSLTMLYYHCSDDLGRLLGKCIEVMEQVNRSLSNQNIAHQDESFTNIMTPNQSSMLFQVNWKYHSENISQRHRLEERHISPQIINEIIAHLSLSMANPMLSVDSIRIDRLVDAILSVCVAWEPSIIVYDRIISYTLNTMHVSCLLHESFDRDQDNQHQRLIHHAFIQVLSHFLVKPSNSYDLISNVQTKDIRQSHRLISTPLERRLNHSHSRDSERGRTCIKPVDSFRLDILLTNLIKENCCWHHNESKASPLSYGHYPDMVSLNIPENMF